MSELAKIGCFIVVVTVVLGFIGNIYIESPVLGISILGALALSVGGFFAWANHNGKIYEREKAAREAAEAAKEAAKSPEQRAAELRARQQAQERARRAAEEQEKADATAATCPKCRMKIHRYATICPYCRTSFEDIYRCSACRQMINGQASICPYCGTHFD